MSDDSQQPSETADSPIADPPAEQAAGAGSLHLGWSWWWLLPLLLLIWRVYPMFRSNKPAGDATALVNQSLSHAQANRFNECLAAAKDAMKVDPKMPEAYLNAGWCAGKLGRFDEGIQYTREALRLRPGLDRAQGNLDWMLAQSNQAKPTNPADDALNISLQYANSGRFPECVSTAKSALALHPDWAWAYNNIGYCQAKMGAWTEAIRNTREALRLQPDYKLAANNLAWMLQEQAKSGRSK